VRWISYGAVRTKIILHYWAVIQQVQSLMEFHADVLKDVEEYIFSYTADISDNINWISKRYAPMKAWFDEQVRKSTR
jgi:hypothetical protein